MNLVLLSLGWLVIFSVPRFGFAEPKQAASSASGVDVSAGAGVSGPLEQKLKWDSGASSALDLWNADLQKAGGKLSRLARVRTNEMQRKFGECARLAGQEFATASPVRPWVLLTWLRCARRDLESKPGTAGAEQLEKAVVSLGQNLQWSYRGPWRDALLREELRSRLLLADRFSNRPRRAWPQLEALLGRRESLDKEYLARVYALGASIASVQNRLELAEHYLELSLSAQDSAEIRTKLANTKLLLKRASEPDSRREDRQDLQPSAGELEGETRLQQLFAAKDWVGFLEVAASHLQKFPGGRRAKWTQDRILEAVSIVADRRTNDDASESQNANLVMRQALSALQRLEPHRTLEVLRAAHRRGDFSLCHQLGEKTKLPEASPQELSLIYLRIRCAQLSGNYQDGVQLAEDFERKYFGAEELPEVLFRRAVSHLRLQQVSQANLVWERLLAHPNSDRYRLSARHWLAVGWQQLGEKERAQVQIDQILATAPLSYFGIRWAAAGSADGKFRWQEAWKDRPPIAGQFFLLSSEKESLQRAEILSRNGWILEAQWEILSLPTPTQLPARLLWARRISQMGGYSLSLRWVNEGFSAPSDLRSLDFLQLALPDIFVAKVQEESRLQGLQPVLVQSLIRQESAFAVAAVSSANAQGLMQLIPPTADEVATELGLGKLSYPEDLQDVGVNLRLGTRYLARMIRQFGGSVPLGLAAYNAGPTRMMAFVRSRPETRELMNPEGGSGPWADLWMEEIPWFETSFYVKAILRNVVMYTTLRESEMEVSGAFWRTLAQGPGRAPGRSAKKETPRRVQLPAPSLRR